MHELHARTLTCWKGTRRTCARNPTVFIYRTAVDADVALTLHRIPYAYTHTLMPLTNKKTLDGVEKTSTSTLR